MNYYEVYYETSSGERVKEYFQFSHIEKLISFLQRQQLDVIKIKKVSKLLLFLQGFFAKKIAGEEVIELINHLHIIIKSGLPLYQSLEDLALETENIKLKKILFTMSKRIQSGESLSSSMEPFHKVFGFSTIYLIRVGEETGALETTLNKAKIFLTQSMKIKRDATLALIYPVIIFTVALIAIVIWFSFVLPQVAEIFEQMQISLPALTKVLIVASDIISASYLYVILSVIFVALILYKANKSSKRVQRKLTEVALKLPLVGAIIQKINIAYISEFLYVSMTTGTSLFQAITIVSENMTNIVYKESMKQIKIHLSNGLPLSEALQKEKLYNAFTIRMVNMGEQSGDLESQLYTIANYYQDSVQTAIDKMTKVIEPAMIIFIGGLFAIIMLGLMGPMFDLIATI